jgi:hypothetical protein
MGASGLTIQLPTCNTINRRVGVKLPQHLLLLHRCAAKKIDHS